MCEIEVLDDFSGMVFVFGEKAWTGNGWRNTFKSQLSVLPARISDSPSKAYCKNARHSITWILKIFVAPTKLGVEQSRPHRFLSFQYKRERRHFSYVEKPRTFEVVIGSLGYHIDSNGPSFFLLFENNFRKFRKYFSFHQKEWKQGYYFGSNGPLLFLIGFYVLIILIDNSLKWKKWFNVFLKDWKLDCYFDNNRSLMIFNFFVTIFLFEKRY